MSPRVTPSQKKKRDERDRCGREHIPTGSPEILISSKDIDGLGKANIMVLNIAK
jgi:hypothetical protein